MVQLEWNLDVSNQAVHHTKIEIEKVSAETHGEWADAVAVAGIVVQPFPIIDEIVGAFILDGVKIAKHQDGGKKGANNAFFISLSHTMSAEELLVVRINRQVRRTPLLE